MNKITSRNTPGGHGKPEEEPTHTCSYPSPPYCIEGRGSDPGLARENTLYMGDKIAGQVAGWPPRNTERGWELDIFCAPELLEVFQRSQFCAFRVNDTEFTGLEAVRATVAPIDELAKTTLIFRYCRVYAAINRDDLGEAYVFDGIQQATPDRRV